MAASDYRLVAESDLDDILPQPARDGELRLHTEDQLREALS